MTYQKFHKEFTKLAPKKKNPTIDRIIPTDPGGHNLDIRIPAVKNFAKKFYKENKPSFQEAVALADEIFKRRVTEEIVFAIELTTRYPQTRDVKFFERATGWIKFLTNWENCDRLAGQIFGKILLKNPQLIFKLKKWATAKFYWQRRCAIVSFIPPLAHEGRNKLYARSKFIKPCLQICAKLGQDQQMYVQKAVGWPIREITKWGGQNITYPWLIKNKNKLSSFVWHASLEKFNQTDKLKLKSLYKKNGTNIKAGK